MHFLDAANVFPKLPLQRKYDAPAMVSGSREERLGNEADANSMVPENQRWPHSDASTASVAKIKTLSGIETVVRP